MCYARHLLAIALVREGRHDEAISLARAAVADSLEHGGRVEAHARCNLATVLLVVGDAAAAVDEARAALAAAPPGAPVLSLVQATLASAALAHGAIDEARMASRVAMEIVRSGKAPRDVELFARLVELRVLQRDAAPDLGPRLEEAKQELLTRAERLTDEAQRASFLANVPENKAILAFGNAA